jgi:cobalt-precorrin 5A hydrolase
MGGGPVIRVAGIGLNARATGSALAEVVERLGPCDRMATLADRAQRLSALAGRGVAAVASVSGIATPTQSPRIARLHGTGSVAEACAIVAAGRDARIVIPRIISRDGTVTGAVAEGEGP